MNLGDGLKLETELLDGKTKLILSPSECKSKISVKMGNKTKIAKCPLRTKQNGHILKPTQKTCIRSEKLLQKKIVGSETSLAKGEKNSMTLSPTKDLCKQYTDKDCLHIQKEIVPAAPNIQKTRYTKNIIVVGKQKPCRKHFTDKNLESSLVCLTQDQLQQILMTVNQGNKSTSFTENEKEETNEQVALKKKEKVSEKWDHLWKKSENDKIAWEKCQIFDQSKAPSQATVLQTDEHSFPRASQTLEEAVLLEHPFSTTKQEQQRKWIEELNKQIEDDQQRKREEKISSSKGEEHERWAIHFDSLKSYPGSQSQLSSRLTHKQPEYFCISPDTQELTDVFSVYTPTTGSQVEPSEEEHVAKPAREMTMPNSHKTNFLRSMTALLDPAQIEERDRRRQKQLEHQKAITAQVEEKRRKKQLEEQQRKKEEQEEEHRLAREREEMQKQYEEDMLRQKQKEEIMAFKTNELFQTMQRAQELALRLKQEQKIRELSQKGHDTSRLIKNLGVDTVQWEQHKPFMNISNSRQALDEPTVIVNTCINSTISPKKDTGVQTDDLNTGISAHQPESHCGSVTENEIIHCSSPEISAEFNEQLTKKNKHELVVQDKAASLEKENSWFKDQYSHFTRIEKKTKHTKKCPKRPDWNINKPPKRYIPASEKYPKQLQKQREEKKIRRQMELLHLLERNNPGYLSQNRGLSPEAHKETESKWQLIKKEEETLKVNSFSKERSQSPPMKNSNYGSLTSGNSHTELSPGTSEPSHFIPYVRTNEIYYLDPDAPLSRSSSQDPQNQNPHDQEQLLSDSEHVKDPLLNPTLVKNRDRQQAILKGLSELRQIQNLPHMCTISSLQATSSFRQRQILEHQSCSQFQKCGARIQTWA
ncbi:coiled-coil domain-containing protein 66 isoform X6 [Erinaceus europaeus]|uniref:Coiled-coil domain-containing protein 66 isoform X6 n=1 Tax=Erinaceus europaeus TaxID=9365 RepID=A0ABM3YDC6_ERIEU|nr:coiled-coil domain-containing protein 66 isoform X6 [Erinaceus europaeus]